MQFSKEILKGALDAVVLKALSTYGESYGYELIQHINHDSDGIFELREGTVYPLLYRLEDQKLIKSYRKTTPQGKERRYYELTKAGQKHLEERVTEYVTFLKAMKQALHLAA
jgi:PadR family transcriptional regulator PadR